MGAQTPGNITYLIRLENYPNVKHHDTIDDDRRISTEISIKKFRDDKSIYC